MATPLEEAHELIASLSAAEDAHSLIHKLEKLTPEDLSKELVILYDSAEHLAQIGDTEQISILLRVFARFGDRSHDWMLLHYFAQAEANETIHSVEKEKRTDEEHERVLKALKLISEAFSDADTINTETGVK